jgi:hypothetical protein
MRFLRLLLPISLAVAAAVLGATGMEGSPSSIRALFQQGGLRPLLRAEASMARGDVQGALAAWSVCVLRAKRESIQGLAEQVRLRVGGAGEFAWSEAEKAWPLLVRYSLWSADFTRASSQAENFILSKPSPPTRFEYAVTAKDGRESAWGVPVAKAPLWLYRKLPPDFRLNRVPGALYNCTPSELPAQGDWSWVLNSSLPITPSSLPLAWCIRSRSPASFRWWPGLENLVQWGSSLSVGADGRACATLEIPRYLYMDRILAIGDGPLPPFQVTLVHEYTPLNSKLKTQNP